MFPFLGAGACSPCQLWAGVHLHETGRTVKPWVTRHLAEHWQPWASPSALAAPKSPLDVTAGLERTKLESHGSWLDQLTGSSFPTHGWGHEAGAHPSPPGHGRDQGLSSLKACLDSSTPAGHPLQFSDLGAVARLGGGGGGLP